MKCEGKCGLLREAEYKVTMKEEHGKLIEYKEQFLCGVCMLDRCFATNGLRDDVVKGKK